MRLGPPPGARGGPRCLAWPFPADVCRPPHRLLPRRPGECQETAWQWDSDTLLPSISSPHPGPSVPMFRDPGLWAWTCLVTTPGLNPWACGGPEQCSEAVPCCITQACGVPTAPSRFAVLFALMGRQVWVPWTDAVGGVWCCVWAGGRSGHTSCCLAGRGDLFSGGLSLRPPRLRGLDGGT